MTFNELLEKVRTSICFEAPKDAPCINCLRKGDGLGFQFVDSFRINDKVETVLLP